jgi:integrase
MSRKGANIYKRKDGRWEARYVKSIGADGKKQYGSVYGTSYTEAREKQLLFIGNYTPYQQTKATGTLSAVMCEWLISIEHTVKKSTYQKYRSITENHVNHSALGSLPIKYLTSRNISEFASAKLSSGKLSEKTVNDILVVISLALTYAEEAYGIKKPRIHHIKEPLKEMRVLSVEEQVVLERYLRLDMGLYQFGILLALYTGIRIGELCALDWSDIHDGYVVISKTLHRIKDGNKTILEITEPKTKASNRTIPLPTYMQELTEVFRGEGSVLKTRSRGRVEPRLMQMTFERMIDECGLPKTNFHALRHTFATRCIEAGFDVKSLSEILGHSDVKTTLNKYVHSSYELKQKNMELLKPAIEL